MRSSLTVVNLRGLTKLTVEKLGGGGVDPGGVLLLGTQHTPIAQVLVSSEFSVAESQADLQEAVGHALEPESLATQQMSVAVGQEAVACGVSVPAVHPGLLGAQRPLTLSQVVTVGVEQHFWLPGQV